MPKIKKIDSKTFISKEYKGPMKKLPFKEYTKDLKRWAREKKARSHGQPVLFYYHPYDDMAEEEFRVDVAKPIKRLKKGGGGYKLKFLPKTKLAIKNFKGSPSDYKEVYEELLEWIDKKGYQPYGNRMEKIKKFPEKDADDFIIKSQIQMPVKKK